MSCYNNYITKLIWKKDSRTSQSSFHHLIWNSINSFLSGTEKYITAKASTVNIYKTKTMSFLFSTFIFQLSSFLYLAIL